MNLNKNHLNLFATSPWTFVKRMGIFHTFVISVGQKQPVTY